VVVRVWDVAAGYLNRQSLLGEHRELHGLRSILVYGKTGYSRHPETLRWVGCLSGLARRHAMLVAEMAVRGYSHRSPVEELGARSTWPTSYVTEPREQLALLKRKYVGKVGGRIPLPKNAQELWASHKYSVMARDPHEYRTTGRRVAAMRRQADISSLVLELSELLREPPPKARLVNALEHMWGHVSDSASDEDRRRVTGSVEELLQVVQELVAKTQEPYLVSSTALSELAAYLDAP
jgi:pyrimidine dimer DNA glycosylase/uncharacterized protein DUF1722